MLGGGGGVECGQRPHFYIFLGGILPLKHLPVFLLGTENVLGWEGGIVVVVCGKIW